MSRMSEWFFYKNRDTCPLLRCSAYIQTHLTPPMSNQSFSQPSDDDESWMSIATIVTEIK